MSDYPNTWFRAILELDIGDTDREEFSRAWQRMAVIVAQQPANLMQSLNIDAEQPSTAYIVSDWTDREHFREFSSNPDHETQVAELKKLCRAVSMTQMHNIITVAPASSK